MSPLPPRVVADRYELRSLLGRGGVGAVWSALDRQLDREVAVKEVPFPAYLPEAELEAVRQRVRREARAAARLSHPGVVAVYDIVQTDYAAFLVMELVRAPTLAALVADGGPLDPARAARVGLQILDALEVAHAAGIVHRDVKPGNVMVRDLDRVALADFGIARLVDDPGLTRTGTVVGSPSYMAPEQARGDDIGPGVDLWGLGATLYYAVEGRPPFARGDALPTLAAVVGDDPDPVERAGALAPVLTALLEKDPRQRITAGEVRPLLDEVARGAPPREATLVGVPAAAAPLPPVTAPTGGRPPEPARRDDDLVRGRARSVSRTGLLTALAAAVLLLGGAALIWSSAGGADDDLALRPSDADAEPPDPVPVPPAEEPATEEPATTAPASDEPPSEEPSAPSEEPTAEEPTPEDTAAEEPATEEPPTDEPSPTASEPEPTEPGTGEAAAAGVPADWVPYTDPAIGYVVPHPPGWEVIDREGNLTDIRDPETGAYLRVDWTDSPPPSPESSWEELSAAFADSREAYTEIGITPTTYRGFDAALWEYTYTDGGAELHAANLGIDTGPYGYALNFQTRAADWESSQDLYEAFQAGFEPSAVPDPG